MQTIFDKLNVHFQDQKRQILYSFLDINGIVREEFTYGAFEQRIAIIAGNLGQRYRLKKGDRVLLCYPPGLEMICAFFACAKIGLLPVPVYPPGTKGFHASLQKMSYIAQDCQAVAVLTSRAYYWSFKLNIARNLLPELGLKKQAISKLQWIITKDFQQKAAEPVVENCSEILFIQYTSGSTNHPKGVMVSHQNIIANCDTILDFSPIGVSWLPQYHDMGLIGYFLFIALKGGTTYCFSPLDFIQRPGLWLETISKYKATASSAPNFAYEYCLRPDKIPSATLGTLDLSSLKVLMVAAEPVNVKSYCLFWQKFAAYGLKKESFYAAYGLAEFTLAATSFGRTFVNADMKKLGLGQLSICSPGRESIRVMSCGKPLKGVAVKIVDKDRQIELQEGHIGEIWLSGTSKCSGYWNKAEKTEEVFYAKITGSNKYYLRTGDIGFLYAGELFICGREKDMIIVRGLNYYPQDMERTIASASPDIRKGGVTAFGVTIADEEKVVVLVEVKKGKAIPNGHELLAQFRLFFDVDLHEIVFIAPRTTPKTSSGKVARYRAKEAWEAGELEIKSTYYSGKEASLASTDIATDDFLAALKIQYNLSGDEPYALNEIGIGSLDLAILLQDVQDLLKRQGAGELAEQIDLRLLQQISVCELFELVAQINTATAAAFQTLKFKLAALANEHQRWEYKQMLADTKLTFDPDTLPGKNRFADEGGPVFLTGGTGFLGPFLLKSLLEQTTQHIYVLVRAKGEKHGKERLLKALRTTAEVPEELLVAFEQRVIPVCGDLGLPHFGLSEARWQMLARQIQTIYHNGAIVNYLLGYEQMRAVNVGGTNELLKLAFEGHAKTFNHISTTFIFGWAVTDILSEADDNKDIKLLDFGYSQSKWVSEQLVKNAMKKGLKARIFRPALISPASGANGRHFDITIRLFAFMINHGMGIEALNQLSLMPADIAANNMVAISQLTATVNQCFHVTRDHYANMMDVTAILSRLTGQQFEGYTIPEFVDRMVECCQKDDLLFPLLDFFTRSMNNIAAMEFKRYDSRCYQAARNKSIHGQADPSLEDTLISMVAFMKKNEILKLPAGLPV